MPKFPDPTKNYSAEPVDAAIDASKMSGDKQVYQSPSSSPPPAFPPSEASAKADPPSSPPPEPPSSSPPDLPVSPSPFRNLIPLLIGIAAFGLLAFLGIRFLPSLLGGGTSGPITLTYWGLWEPASVMEEVISDYEREHPNVQIDYQMQSPKNYRTRLQSALQNGTGPDIARIHNTWLPMFPRSFAPAPDGLINTSDFYPVVTRDFVRGGKLYAVPLEVDGLALYYNVDILAEKSAEPPTDWNSFRKLAFDLTKHNNETGVIERAGAAMGTTSNIDHWSDILGLLILQNSGNPSTPSDAAVQDALTFYTIFSTSDQTWDSSQPNSTYAFATGTLAMMLAPAWYTAEIEAINPTLNYATAPVPRLATTNLGWATYWAEAVSAASDHPEAAWEFLAYLSSSEALQKLYTNASQLRPLGEPYPRVSMGNLLTTDPLAAPFITQASNYQSWYLSARTFDEGINDEFIKYYEDAVNAINNGSTVGAVLKTLDAGAAQVAGKYNLAQ